MTSAPLGIEALPLVTLCTRSPSTMTTALVRTRPVPSTNLPNLIAFVAASAGKDVAKNKKTVISLAMRIGPPNLRLTSSCSLYFDDFDSNAIGTFDHGGT